jgi:hypothetical protein
MRTDVRAYSAVREVNGPVRASVAFQDGHEEALPHLVRHSPTGFEMGYAGSGPADLARSVIGHFLEDQDPSPRIYQRFKFAFVTPAEGGFVVTANELREWLAEFGDELREISAERARQEMQS